MELVLGRPEADPSQSDLTEAPCSPPPSRWGHRGSVSGGENDHS